MSRAAEIAVARTRVKQALAACRTAAQRLAQAQDIDVIGQRTCNTPQDVDAVTAVLRLALTEHGQVDVVVLATPKQ
jgi:RNase P protein component